MGHSCCLMGVTQIEEFNFNSILAARVGARRACPHLGTPNRWWSDTQNVSVESGHLLLVLACKERNHGLSFSDGIPVQFGPECWFSPAQGICTDAWTVCHCANI